MIRKFIKAREEAGMDCGCRDYYVSPAADISLRQNDTFNCGVYALKVPKITTPIA